MGSALGRSAVGPLTALIFLGIGGYGGYYGYCRYKLGDAISEFDQQAGDELHNWLTRRNHNIGPEDIRQFVTETAARHELTVAPAAVSVTIEPYNEQSAQRLAVVMRQGLAMAAKISGARGTPPALWVVGFRAAIEGRRGRARATFASEHYTWFEWVKQ